MNRAAHLAALLGDDQRLWASAAKAAECSPSMLRAAMQKPELLSRLQWTVLEARLGVPSGWLGSGGAWTAHHAEELVRNTRGRLTSPVELQRVRRTNLRRLATACKPANSLAKLLNTSPSMLADLMGSEARTFGPRRARALELGLGLPEGWLDREGEEVPPALLVRLQQAAVQSQARRATERLRAQVPEAASLNTAAATNLIAVGHLRPLHQAVLAKYQELATAGLLDESFAFELMGTLLAHERGARTPVSGQPAQSASSED